MTATIPPGPVGSGRSRDRCPHSAESGTVGPEHAVPEQGLRTTQSTRGMLLRVTRLREAAGVTAVFAVGGAVWAGSTPAEWVYEAVPSLGRGALVTYLAAVLLAALLGLPSLEALEITASRRLWPLRLALVFAALAGTAVVCGAVCAAVGSAWHLYPLMLGGTLLVCATFTASTVLPSHLVALPALAYTVTCCFTSAGQASWDVLMTTPTLLHTILILIAGLLGVLVFCTRGARPAPGTDDW
ncbi:MAG: hypothetical protein QG671_2089 [Actinomycetota bacterium]|nr:hypothetical protein [Actinomycetota bacterium]